jgi:AbrB family looped-hinge helix DNA binding protein
MKKSLRKKHNFPEEGQTTMYGTTVLGARGQVVIPAEARRDLKLKPGDRLIVMSRFNKILGMIKADAMNEFVDLLMEKINSKEIKKEIKQEALRALSELKRTHQRRK